MHADPSNLRQRFILLEEGGPSDDCPTPRKRRIKSRKKRLALFACVTLIIAYCKVVAFRVCVESFASAMLSAHGGACTTASEAAIAFGAPSR